MQKSFDVDQTLFEVAAAVKEESGFEITSFTQNYPKKSRSCTSFILRQRY